MANVKLSSGMSMNPRLGRDTRNQLVWDRWNELHYATECKPLITLKTSQAVSHNFKLIIVSVQPGYKPFHAVCNERIC